MADLQRRRGSLSLLPRLRLPSHCATGEEEIDFSFAVRSILELLVRRMATLDDLTLDAVVGDMQGFEEGEEPQFISNVVCVVSVKAAEMEEALQSAAESIVSSHTTAKDYHETLNHFLNSELRTPAASDDVITRHQVLFLFALCSCVSYRCLKLGKRNEFRLFLPWSTEFIADLSRVPSFVQSRGGWSRAFQSKTPHCGPGTIGIIASFFVLTTIIFVAHRRGGC